MRPNQFVQLKQLHRIYNELYGNDEIGFIGVATDYIQLTEQGFVSLVSQCDAFHEIVVMKYRGENWYEATVSIDGIKWLTIGTQEEFKAVGLPLSNRKRG
jgi:hypothetical protein